MDIKDRIVSFKLTLKRKAGRRGKEGEGAKEREREEGINMLFT